MTDDARSSLEVRPPRDDSAAEPWRTAFELAWEALRAGSVPVGAVAVDPAGTVIAAGPLTRQLSLLPAYVAPLVRGRGSLTLTEHFALRAPATAARLTGLRC